MAADKEGPKVISTDLGTRVFTDRRSQDRPDAVDRRILDYKSMFNRVLNDLAKKGYLEGMIERLKDYDSRKGINRREIDPETKAFSNSEIEDLRNIEYEREFHDHL